MSNDDKEFVVIEDNDMPIDNYKKIDNKYKINGYVRDFSISNDDIVDINKKLESLAKDENITYIDMFSELVDSDGNLKLEYTEEGLHMSDDGYDKITEVLIKYIKEND